MTCADSRDQLFIKKDRIYIDNGSDAEFRLIRGPELPCNDDVQGCGEGFRHFVSHHKTTPRNAKNQRVLTTIAPFHKRSDELTARLTAIFKTHCFHL